MRLSTVLLVLALVASVAGCSRNGPSTFTAEFPAQPDLGVDAVPISLIDQTGLVTTVRTAPPGDVRDGPRVEAEPNIANGLRVSWLGEGCDNRLSLVFGPSARGYELAIHVDPNAAGGFGCVDVTIARGLSITLSEPVDPASVTVSRPFP